MAIKLHAIRPFYYYYYYLEQMQITAYGFPFQIFYHLKTHTEFTRPTLDVHTNVRIYVELPLEIQNNVYVDLVTLKLVVVAGSKCVCSIRIYETEISKFL